MEYEGIIFDFDYTLGDSTKGIVQCIHYAMEKLGHSLPGVEAIRKTIGLSLPKTYYALTHSKDEEKAKRFSAYFVELADKVMVDNTAIYPEAISILEELKGEAVKVGIVTTKNRYRIEQILSKYNMEKYVDQIVGAEDVSAEKPDPEGLLSMMPKLQVEKSKVLYVGDSLVDAQTASSAGISFAGVLTGTTTTEDFKKFNYVMVMPNVGEIGKRLGLEEKTSKKDLCLIETGRKRAQKFLSDYAPVDKGLKKQFELRNILPGEAEQAALIEARCFPPNEACSRAMMLERIAVAPELFLVAVDRQTGKLAGFLNGLSTDEQSFRDEFFTDTKLYEPSGRNIMLLGLDVLPEYRRKGLAKEIMYQYLRREQEKKRQKIMLTCLKSKIEMYEKMGFQNQGIANSFWGAEQWYEMSCILNF